MAYDRKDEIITVEGKWQLGRHKTQYIYVLHSGCFKDGRQYVNGRIKRTSEEPLRCFDCQELIPNKLITIGRLII